MESAVLTAERASRAISRVISRAGVTRVPLSDALACGPELWEDVLAGAESQSPFMSWAWHDAWAGAAPAADVAASEVLVQRDAGGAVVSLLPVGYRRVAFRRIPVTALSWAIGDLGCPDHLDVPAMAATDVAPLVPVLEKLPWEVLILSNLAPTALVAHQLCEAFEARGFALVRRALWGCPYLDLSGDWESYLATLTPTRRQTLRRKERSLQRHHRVEITDYEDDRFEEGWRHLVRLHEKRWKGAGALHLPSDVQLHHRFAAEMAARGELWLSTLDLDGEPAAAWYGFTCRDTVYFYQSGRDPRWERESVGLLLMAAMIRRAIERGYRHFDFLRGEDAYKGQWTVARRSTEEVTIFRPGFLGLCLRALDSAATLR